MSEGRVVLSPHLDDAALSVATTLQAQPGTAVVTCFAGIPDPEQPLAAWDRRCGYDSGVQASTARRANDVRALSSLGARATHLDLLDVDYRRTDTAATTAALTDLLRPLVTPAAEVWLPIALGRHPDHKLVVQAGVAAWRAAPTPRPRLVLYADLPYASTCGWPSWVLTGGRQRLPVAWTRHVLRWRRHQPQMQWSGALATTGLPVRRLVPTVRPLSADQLAVKLAALEPYREQTDQLTYGPGGGWTLREALAYEAWWTLRA